MPRYRSSLVLLATLALAAAGVARADTHATAASAGELAARIAAAKRPADEVARDAGRKPAEVLAFLGLAPGMTVLDVIAAGGWYTEVLSAAVGPEGRVYAQNPESVLRFREGRNDKALTARLAEGRLANVVRLDRETADLGLAPGSVDLAITALNYHDVHFRGGEEATGALLAAVKEALAPGGVFGIIDHVGGVGDDAALHRIDPALVEKAALAAGFEIAGRSDVLRNPEDDHTQSVFAEGLRGHTDRFVLKLRKP